MKNGIDRLQRALRELAEADDRHPDLQALNAFAAERREQGEGWQMPDHLAQCPVCLAAFEALIMDQPVAPSDAARERFIRIFNEGAKPAPRFRRQTNAWFLKAALFAIIAGGAVMTFMLFRMPRALRGEIAQGQVLCVDDRRPLGIGKTVEPGSELEALAPSLLRLSDGTTLAIDIETRFSIAIDPAGCTVVTIEAGRIEFDVRPQPPKRPFKVRTGLGGVNVVGTRFSVACRTEDVTAFENRGGGQAPKAQQAVIASVVVAVSSGTVRVFNASESVALVAGRIATLRNNAPLIEVLDGPVEGRE